MSDGPFTFVKSFPIARGIFLTLVGIGFLRLNRLGAQYPDHYPMTKLDRLAYRILSLLMGTGGALLIVGGCILVVFVLIVLIWGNA